MTDSFAHANPLIGLTGEEYKELVRALVSYVALHATVDQTTYFMDLYRDYTFEIAGKVAVGGRGRRPMVPTMEARGRTGAPGNITGSALRKSRSH